MAWQNPSFLLDLKIEKLWLLARSNPLGLFNSAVRADYSGEKIRGAEYEIYYSIIITKTKRKLNANIKVYIRILINKKYFITNVLY